MKKVLFKHLTPFFLVLIMLVAGCKKDPTLIENPNANFYSSTVPLEWFKLMEEIDRYAEGYRPPAAARAMAYIGLTGYEAVVNGMPNYKSLGSHFPGLNLPQIDKDKEYHWPAAANAAYFQIISLFYPHLDTNLKNRIDVLNQITADDLKKDVSNEAFERSLNFGKDVANTIYEWSKLDVAGHEAYLDPRPDNYSPPSGPGRWEPTPPNFTPALFPYWGSVRTFALKQSDLLAKPPVPWSEDSASDFYKEAKEVMDWTNRIKAGEDDESHWIAEFWSDDFFEVTFTPAGRWVAIANQVVSAENIKLDKAVELYAKLGMALCDAGIAIWHSKYHYNLERPISYIQRNLQQDWETIMNHPISGVTGLNPEFPAYPSGHSGFGGAAAIVLTDVFGYYYEITDKCHEHRIEFNGSPRYFRSFIDMATENAYSRIPLGVHYRMDCAEGISQGYLAGQKVLELPWN